jgi:DNA-binding MarR family transcriptional regulator
MTRPHPAEPIDLGILIGLAYQTFVDELRAELHDRGFTDLGGAYGYVFRALGTESLRLGQLAERLGMTDQGASKIIDEMEARGYVERRADPNDGRAKALRLGRRGRAALRAARRFHRAYERRLVATVSARDVATARRVLSTIVAGGGTEVAKARLRAL